METLHYGYKTITDGENVTYWDITNETYRQISQDEAENISKIVKARLNKIRKVNDENRKNGNTSTLQQR